MNEPTPRPALSAPPFLKWLFGHMLVGVAVGWAALAVILATDVGGVRTLIAGSPDGRVALVLLAVFFAITFGSAGMGFAVMSEPRERVGDGD